MSAAAPAPAPPEPVDLRLLPAALSAWLVCCVLDRQGTGVRPGIVLPVAAVGALAGVLLLLRSPRRTAAGAAAVLLCASAAGVCTVGRVAGRTQEPLPGLVAHSASLSGVAVVTDDPQAAGPQPGGRSLVVVAVRLERLTRAGRTYRLRAPVVVLAADGHWLGLLPGQRLALAGRLRPAEARDAAAAVLLAAGPPGLLGRPPPVQRAAGALRAGLRRAVAVLPPDERGLLPGLVDGDTSRLDQELREDFRTTGLTHLVAVSGTNCAIVAGVVLLLSRRLGAGLRLAPVLAGVALLGFVELARPSPSVLRAAVMGAVGLLALGTGGRRQAVPALCASVLLLVLLDPDLAPTPGFALSVLATGGLLLLAPAWVERLATRLPRRLAEAVAVPAAAQVVCGPVVVALSGALGLLSVPANLLAVPAVAPATVLGVLCALVAPFWLPLAQGLAWLAWAPTAWLVLVARTGAGLPGARLGWPTGAPGAALLVLGTLVGAVVVRRRLLRRLVAAGSVGVLLAVVGLAAVRPAWPPPGWFMVSCDVGQGDAHVLSLGPGRALVVDAGPQPRAIDRCLRRLRVHQVPLLVLTHLHADHVDGLPGVLHGRTVGQIEVGPLDQPAERWAQVRRAAHDAHVPVVPARLGEARRDGSLSWQVLAPTHAYRGTRSDPNNSSLVLLVRTGGLRVLLTGDVEPEAQDDLLRRVPDLRADVLKVPHHGSDHQDPAFLRAVHPRIAVTEVGAGNRYGHPSASTLGLLLGEGARSYRTDRDGDVALVDRGGLLLTSGRTGSGTFLGVAVGTPPSHRLPIGTGMSPARSRPPVAALSVPRRRGVAGDGRPVERAGQPAPPGVARAPPLRPSGELDGAVGAAWREPPVPPGRTPKPDVLRGPPAGHAGGARRARPAGRGAPAGR